jgi:hypothetical protein
MPLGLRSYQAHSGPLIRNCTCRKKRDAVKYAGDKGFSSVFEKGDLELQIKGTRIESETVARQMSVVEFGNLEKLYGARGNPYEGQITEFVECDKVYKPKVFEFSLDGGRRRALLVAANERKLFGACAKSQVYFWVSYFNFYDASAKMMIEARLFHRAEHANARRLAELSRKLEKSPANCWSKSSAGP